MQKLGIYIIAIIALFTSCSDSGTSYPPDYGDDLLATTFEVTGSFTPSNNYAFLFDFAANGFVPYESDAVLAYILWSEEGGDDYWRQLPQTTFVSGNNILIYNFDFRSNIGSNKIYDIEFFLDGNINPEFLDPIYTLDQTFKIVVVPSEFLRSNSIDTNNIDAILQSDAIQVQELN